MSSAAYGKVRQLGLHRGYLCTVGGLRALWHALCAQVAQRHHKSVVGRAGGAVSLCVCAGIARLVSC